MVHIDRRRAMGRGVSGGDGFEEHGDKWKLDEELEPPTEGAHSSPQSFTDPRHPTTCWPTCRIHSCSSAPKHSTGSTASSDITIIVTLGGLRSKMIVLVQASCKGKS